jgi:hypothetical protein
MTSEIRKETRIRDRLRKKYIKNRIGTNERKYKNQLSGYTFMYNLHEFFSKQITRYIHVSLIVNNTAPVSVFYVSINESLPELKNTNCKQYWKTIKMLIKGEVPSQI